MQNGTHNGIENGKQGSGSDLPNKVINNLASDFIDEEAGNSMTEKTQANKRRSSNGDLPRNKQAGNDPENLADISKDSGEWGEIPDSNFGYASDEERRAKRGLEDWELVDSVPDCQERVPPWFFAVIVAVLLVAIGLSFPFWGERPGYEKESWLDWGFGVAILYLIVFGTFVYYMVAYYGSVEAADRDIVKKPESASGSGSDSNDEQADDVKQSDISKKH